MMFCGHLLCPRPRRVLWEHKASVTVICLSVCLVSDPKRSRMGGRLVSELEVARAWEHGIPSFMARTATWYAAAFSTDMWR